MGMDALDNHEAPAGRERAKGFSFSFITAVSIIFLLLDLATVVLGILTFEGLPECCGQVLRGSAGYRVEAARSIAIAYLCLVFVEFFPLVFREMAVVILNPIIGYMVALYSFFFSSQTEAIVMASLEKA